MLVLFLMFDDRIFLFIAGRMRMEGRQIVRSWRVAGWQIYVLTDRSIGLMGEKSHHHHRQERDCL
jgi:hypothetical protein